MVVERKRFKMYKEGMVGWTVQWTHNVLVNLKSNWTVTLSIERCEIVFLVFSVIPGVGFTMYNCVRMYFWRHRTMVNFQCNLTHMERNFPYNFVSFTQSTQTCECTTCIISSSASGVILWEGHKSERSCQNRHVKTATICCYSLQEPLHIVALTRELRFVFFFRKM